MPGDAVTVAPHAYKALLENDKVVQPGRWVTLKPGT